MIKSNVKNQTFANIVHMIHLSKRPALGQFFEATMILLTSWDRIMHSYLHSVICGINIFGPSEHYLLVTTINVLPSSGSTKHVVNLFQFGVAPVWG